MRKLLSILALGVAGLGTAPAPAELGWSEFVPARHGHIGAVYLVPDGDELRWNRLPSRHEGYFFQRGSVDVRNGRASFDYDRDYSYDYPSYSIAWAEEEPEMTREPSCTIERVRDDKNGWADVRVCRN